MTDQRPSVVHVVRSDSFAGVERYMCDVGRELDVRGWRVAVVGGEPAAMRRALPTGITHLAARTTGAVARALVSLGRVNVVHAHMTAAELAAVTAKPVNRGRLLATRHFAAPRGRGRVAQVVGRVAARSIDLELAISDYVAQASGGSPRVVLNGVPDAESAVDVTSRTVLVVQRLESEKDTTTALRAFSASGLATQGWRLRVAGRGSLEPSLRALARELAVASSVELLGFVADPAELRRQASIFLATAPTEPFGLSLAEAMAAGLPVVAADGGAHREVLGETGLYFEPGDINGCASQLLVLAASAPMRDHLGRSARARQRDYLSVTRHVDELEVAYDVRPGRSAPG